MPRLRTAKTKEEAAAIPEDQTIQVILGNEEEGNLPDEKLGKPAQAVVKEPEVKEARAPAPPPPPEEDEEKIALRKQVEALQKAEKTNQEQLAAERRRAEEAQQRHRELQTESTKHQEDAFQAQYDAILNGIEASRNEAESAQKDLEQAELNGDAKGKAESYRKLARAEANMAKLEDGKSAFESHLQALKDRPKQQERPADPLEAAIVAMPDQVKSWIRSHPEYMTDPRKNAKMQSVHWDAMDEGHAFGTQAYIESVETHLGLREKPKPVEADDEDDTPPAPPQRERTVVTAAPPHREAVSPSTGKAVSSTKITLTPEERGVARDLGLDETEYARQKQRLQELKRNGSYNEGR